MGRIFRFDRASEDFMRRLAFTAPLAAVLALAAAPAWAAEPQTINVTLGPQMAERVDELGAREVQDQVDRLVEIVGRELESKGALDGARLDLVLTDLKPNRPTMQQVADRPGLDPMRSLSIGGAAVEGRITLADGQVQPVRFDWFSTNLADVRGFGTWQDADRAYQRFANNLVAGRYVTR